MKIIQFLLIIPASLGFVCAASNVGLPTQNESEVTGYNLSCTNGLYATISGYLQVKGIDVSGEQSLNISVSGFCKSVSVRAVIQNHRAPLVVVLLGLGGATKADYSKIWPSWLSDAGFHVLYFDSTFGPPFQKASCHGVSGNLFVETERVRDVIAAFLDLEQMRGKVSDVGVAGYSYGAVQALILGKMAKEGVLPFHLGAVQAYGPPIDIAKTAEILDTWFREDRWKYTVAELKRMFQDLPPWEERNADITDSSMRAAIAAVFRMELATVVLSNDAQYKLGELPKADLLEEEYVQREYAEAYSFVRFAYDVSLPYWASKVGKEYIDREVEETKLCRLLEKQPDFTETILSADDPFNSPEDFSRLKACTASHNITVLPCGGHIGYMANPWTRAKLLSMFPPVMAP